MRIYVLTAVIAAATLPLVGCGASASISIGGKNLPNGQLQQQIGTQLAKAAGVKASTVSVSCPSGQKVAKGHTFNCTLTDKSVGKSYTVNVKETDANGKFDATVAPQAGTTATS